MYEWIDTSENDDAVHTYYLASFSLAYTYTSRRNYQIILIKIYNYFFSIKVHIVKINIIKI